MDEAHAPGDERRADTLDALRFGYDQAYRIEVTADGEWRWRRLDGLGGWMEAGGPDELRRQVRDDYSLKPVPRPRPAAQGPQGPQGLGLPGADVAEVRRLSR